MQSCGRIYAFVIILRQKSNTFWQTAFVKIPPLELVEKNLSGDDISVTICRAASRKICPAYGMKPKRGNRGTPGCSRYLCKIVAEAIRAELPGLGKVDYVANSTHMVVGNCCSAGRLYDKIGYTATAKVKYVLASAVVCKVKVPLGAEPAEDGEEDISF